MFCFKSWLAQDLDLVIFKMAMANRGRLMIKSQYPSPVT